MKDTDIDDKTDELEATTSQDDEAATSRQDGDDDKEDKASAADKKTDEPTLVTVIKKQAIEGELPQSKNFTLRKILGGDILNASVLKRYIPVFLIITLFVVVYITNRYHCQQSLIKIDQLEQELKDIKYRALSSSSTLTEMTRESHVLQKLKNSEDSLLRESKQPPYIIKVPKE